MKTSEYAGQLNEKKTDCIDLQEAKVNKLDPFTSLYIFPVNNTHYRSYPKVYIYIYICISIQIRSPISYKNTHAFTHTHTHTHTHIYIVSNIYISIYIYIYIVSNNVDIR